jgi:hypothetical protein
MNKFVGVVFMHVPQLCTKPPKIVSFRQQNSPRFVQINNNTNKSVTIRNQNNNKRLRILCVGMQIELFFWRCIIFRFALYYKILMSNRIEGRE